MRGTQRSRAVLVGVTIAVLGATACGSGSKKTTPADTATSSTSTASSTAPSEAPAFGAATVAAVAVNGSGFVAVGRNGKGEGTRGVAWTAGADGTKWQRDGVGSAVEEAGYAPEAVTVASGHVVSVGSYVPLDPKPGSRSTAAIVVRETSGTWRADYTDVPDGSARLFGVAGNDTTIVAVGAYAHGEIGNPIDTDPLVQVSTDGGETFANIAAPVPTPAGATGAEMLAITTAGAGTPYPGFVAVGFGWVRTGNQRQDIGIVWQSPDGQTWKVVSDETFQRGGRDVLANTVAADASNIIVGGYFGGTATSLAIDGTVWNATGKPEAPWGLNTDKLPAGQSSQTTAMTALPAGGFAVTSQFYDTKAYDSDGPTSSVKLFHSDDGSDYAINGEIDVWKVTGAASTAATLLYVGLAKNGESDVWVGTP